ncbi:hypothetical protein [Hymenobacter sp. AT01-02]|uniref:hypothetical protein n=1 Tax=Hymenobacter sp. AT01-02 TaxID=1571877 RepID=UPI0005F17F64|nr:hypothetical protein [Hymenobacter sp. AT01-02]
MQKTKRLLLALSQQLAAFNHQLTTHLLYLRGRNSRNCLCHFVFRYEKNAPVRSAGRLADAVRYVLQQPRFQEDEDITTRTLPPLPEAPDTTGGKVAPPNPATREINAVNATEDIKKMQPVM